MKQEIKILTPEERDSFLKYFSPQKFDISFNLSYEHQIPNVAIVLVSGVIELINRNKVKAEIHPDSLLGFYNLLNNKPIRYGWRIVEGSELLILEKSLLLKHLEQKNSFLKSFQSQQRS